jgi:hypothetical protein
MTIKRKTTTIMTTGTASRYAKKAKASFVPRPLALARYSRPEVKQVDVPIQSQFFQLASGGGNIILLNGLAVGDDVYNREGRQVQLKGLDIACSIYAGGQTALASFAQDDLRLMIVLDRQPSGAAPVLADFIRTIDSAGSAGTTVFAGQNVNNVSRFKVLKDMHMHQPAWNIGNTNFFFDYAPRTVKTRVKIPVDMRFTGTGNTITSISSNAVWLVLTSGAVDSATNPTWFLNGNVTTYFTDI